MTLVLIVVYMALMARLSGGGLFADRVWSRLPELLFTLPFGVVAHHLTDSYTLSSLAWFCSYFAMEMGHGTFYKMKGYDDHNRPDPNVPRIQTLERIFRPVYNLTGWSIHSPKYSWFMMAIKGLLIGLPAFPYGLTLTVLWPLAYYAGKHDGQDTKTGEWLSGVFAGLVIYMSLQ